jgi:hypothetical protein
MAIAVLDLIVEPEWGLRYFSYQPSWGLGEALASMRDGSGNEYWIVFAADGAAYAQGFDHESELSPWGNEDGELHEGIIDGMPDQFRRYVSEPAFSFENIPSLTVCLWTETGAEGSWRHGSVPPPGSPGDLSGAADLFRVVSRPDPAGYVEYAADYYETEIDAGAVAEIYQHRPLDQALISRISPGRAMEDILGESREIGYPIAE